MQVLPWCPSAELSLTRSNCRNAHRSAYMTYYNADCFLFRAVIIVDGVEPLLALFATRAIFIPFSLPFTSRDHLPRKFHLPSSSWCMPFHALSNQLMFDLPLLTSSRLRQNVIRSTTWHSIPAVSASRHALEYLANMIPICLVSLVCMTNFKYFHGTLYASDEVHIFGIAFITCVLHPFLFSPLTCCVYGAGSAHWSP